MNSPTTTNEIDRPAARAAGPSLCFDAAAPRTIGRIGRTHGDRTDTTPAMKARTMAPVAMSKQSSKGFVQQCLDTGAVGIPDRPAFLIVAFEYHQGLLHSRAEPLDKVLLAVEV